MHTHTFLNQAVAVRLAAALALSAVAAAASATTVIDTGTPNGLEIGAYALDSNDAYAGQVTFAGPVSLLGLQVHLLGVTAGETFTLSVQADSPGHLASTVLYSATAVAAAPGWSGLAGLSGWDLGAGTYWVAVSLSAGDTLGAGSASGALLDRGAPRPLARTAFDAGSGWQATAAPMSFGLRVDAAPVPEPATWALWLVGVAALQTLDARRRAVSRA